MENKTIPTDKYKPELDGIRAIAVLFVIIYHFNEKLIPSGFLGVDIFFVLSGYVVSLSMHEMHANSKLQFIIDFYTRRIKRIFPALIFCIAITALIGCFVMQHPEVTLLTGLYALIGAGNLYLYSNSITYFGEIAQYNLFTHTWSLGVEEQFYLVLPLLFILLKPKNKIKSLPIALGILSLISLIFWYALNPKNNNNFSYFQMPTRLWEFCFGSIAFYSSKEITKIVSKFDASPHIAVISLATILAVPFLPKNYTNITTIVMCLAVALLISSMQTNGFTTSILSRPWIVKIGVLSYSLYLWHWPVISISQHTVGISQHTIFFQVLLIGALSLASYAFIEKPFRYGKISSKKSATVAIILILMLSTASLLVFLNKKPNQLFSADKPRFDITRATFPLDIKFEQCTVKTSFDQFPPKCHYSNPKNPNGPTLWILGDSTAWALKGLASEVAKLTELSVTMFADDSAFPSENLAKIAPNQLRFDEIRDFYKKTYKYVLNNSQSGDIILISTAMAFNFCIEGELFCSKADNELNWKNKENIPIGKNQAFIEFLSEIGGHNKKFKEKGTTLILNAPLPRWERGHRVYCERQWYRPNWENAKCMKPNYSEQTSSRHRITSIIKSSANKSNFLVYDPFPFFCNQNSCDFSNPETNENYWTDETHLSTAGGIKLAPDFIEFLKSKGLIKNSSFME